MLLLQALKIEWAPQCQECLFCGQECIVNPHSKIKVNEGKHIILCKTADDGKTAFREAIL